MNEPQPTLSSRMFKLQQKYLTDDRVRSTAEGLRYRMQTLRGEYNSVVQTEALFGPLLSVWATLDNAIEWHASTEKWSLIESIVDCLTDLPVSARQNAISRVEATLEKIWKSTQNYLDHDFTARHLKTNDGLFSRHLLETAERCPEEKGGN